MGRVGEREGGWVGEWGQGEGRGEEWRGGEGRRCVCVVCVCVVWCGVVWWCVVVVVVVVLTCGNDDVCLNAATRLSTLKNPHLSSSRPCR